MEYIQCPHCGRKYDVSDRIREAAGKTAACKACSEKFEIKLLSEAMPSNTHNDSIEPAKCIVCDATQETKHNFAGQKDPTNGKLLPGKDGLDYLCSACMKSFRHGKLTYPSDCDVSEQSSCMVCSKTRGYNHNYAGKINEIKGNLFPGDPSNDYLCHRCKVKLEGGKKAAAPKKKGVGRQKLQTKDLAAGNELVLLITPIIGILLTWGWVGNMTLINNPASSLNLIAILVVVVTAIGISMEVSKSEVDLKQKGMHSPIKWFVFMALVWFVVYPYYLLKRKDYGYTSRGLAGIVITIIFLISSTIMLVAIEEKKDEVRDILSGVPGLQLSGNRSITSERDSISSNLKMISLGMEVFYLDNQRYPSYSELKSSSSRGSVIALEAIASVDFESNGRSYSISIHSKSYQLSLGIDSKDTKIHDL